MTEDPSQNLHDRVTSLEMLVMHLQHDLEQLNSVVVRQQSELDSLRGLLGRLENRFEQIDSHQENRDPLDEEPPHY